MFVIAGSEMSDVATAVEVNDHGTRRRKEAPLTVLARVAPRLAEHLADHADGLNRFDRRFSPAALDTFARTLEKASALDVESFLAQTYELYRHRKLLADAGLALGRLSADDAGRIYTALADAVVKAMLRACEREFVTRYGRVSGGRHGVVALGSFGGRAPTAGSDLDLMLVYEFDDPSALSDGALPLAACQYYDRMAQRVFAALSCDFGHGPMFDVDFRLRPWGSQGPIATRLTSLREYFATEAWTFEAMALTRARVIAAADGFAAEIDTALRQAVVATAALRDVRSDVAFMRELMQEENASRRVWDLKGAAGGLMDIDFIVQGLVLTNMPAFARKPINDALQAIAVLRRAKALSAADARLLSEALRLYGVAMQFLKVSAPAEPRLMARELAATLSRAAGVDDLRGLERQLRRMQREVERVFAALYGRTRRHDWIHRRAA